MICRSTSQALYSPFSCWRGGRKYVVSPLAKRTASCNVLTDPTWLTARWPCKAEATRAGQCRPWSVAMIRRFPCTRRRVASRRFIECEPATNDTETSRPISSATAKTHHPVLMEVAEFLTQTCTLVWYTRSCCAFATHVCLVVPHQTQTRQLLNPESRC